MSGWWNIEAFFLFYLNRNFANFFNESQNFSINYWIEKGAPSRKIAMGVPLYGQAFQLSDAKNHGLNARAPGPGTAGEFTRSAGFLAYYEVSSHSKKSIIILKKINFSCFRKKTHFRPSDIGH